MDSEHICRDELAVVLGELREATEEMMHAKSQRELKTAMDRAHERMEDRSLAAMVTNTNQSQRSGRLPLTDEKQRLAFRLIAIGMYHMRLCQLAAVGENVVL